jgi:hypothetical protein
LGGRDPRHNIAENPNPIWLQHTNANKRRFHLPDVGNMVPPEQKSVEPFEFFDRNLRVGPLDPQTRDAISELYYETINPDIPFTGWNNSTSPYHTRYLRSIPAGIEPGVAQVSRGSWSLEPAVGDYPVVNSLLGTAGEPHLIKVDAGFSRVGPRLDANRCPILAVPPVLY